jgi:hypothetical protein
MIKRALAVWAAVAAIVVIMLARIVARNGEIVFPLDDPFLHLAIAKHLAEDGVYGVTRESFSAASSSIVWPWVLAALERVVGDHRVTPILLNLAAAGALLVHVGRRTSVWTTALIAVAAPLAPMIVLGMEHVAHAWITVLLLSAGIAARRGQAPARLLVLAGLAALATSLRYESLALVGVLALVLLLRRQLVAALVLGVAGLVPPALFAAFAHAHGAPLLPTSVLLKAHAGGALAVLAGNLREAPHLVAWLVALLLTAGALRNASREAPRDARTLALVVAALLAAHLVFGRVGWFYRYEMYLVVAGAYAVGRAAPHVASLHPAASRAAVALVVAALLVLPLKRAVSAHLATVPAAGNIHDQQLHTARFLERFFAGQKVAVNDAGAVGYLHDGPLVDLLGLADLDVARARGFAIDHPLTREQVRALSAGAKIAIVYDQWFVGAIPEEWTKVATWTIRDNRVCAFPDVAVYSTDASDVASVERLRSLVAAEAR